MLQSAAIGRRRLLDLLTPAELLGVRQQCPQQPGAKVVVGMSGGVDSSLTAALLVALGHLDVRGCWMKNWDMVEEDPTQVAACSQEQDLKDAQFVAKQLDLPPIQEVDLTKEYWCNVWEPCLRQYELGSTPNPDTMCNREIKFDRLFQRLNRTGDDNIIATGHYARLDANNRLCRGLDSNKDQSYFLSTVLPRQFLHACFPIGALAKPRVKQLAREVGLDRIANRPESQGVCFIGERGKRFSSFLEDYLPNKRSGRFRSVLHPAKDLGQHQGLLTYTVGQRARVSGLQEAHFVARKDDDGTGDVWIAPAGHAAHHVDRVRVRFERDMYHAIVGVGGGEEALGGELTCQVRYRTRPIACRLLLLPPPPMSTSSSSSSNNAAVEVDVDLLEPVSVPKGQVLALYVGDRCLGGGEIVHTRHPYFDGS